VVKKAKEKAVEAGLGFRMMFQDEARFGRMNRIYYCWAPKGQRPQSNYQLVREFRYVYGAVSPGDGRSCIMLNKDMTAEGMNRHLTQISQEFSNDYVLLLVDNAGSHGAKELIIPSNIMIYPIPPYSPELNPQELVWKKMRKKFFANKIFATMSACEERIEKAMKWVRENVDDMRRLTLCPWINVSL